MIFDEKFLEFLDDLEASYYNAKNKTVYLDVPFFSVEWENKTLVSAMFELVWWDN